jgi:ABC-type nickel/cobalt efflux system permease component RcnA
MRRVSDLKGAGYLTSTASVALLGAVSWKSASSQPWLMACLVAGVVLSILGMMLRWRSHRLDQAEKEDMERKQEHRHS